MKNIQDYIESGMLELYLSGNTNPGESAEVEAMAADHIEVRTALNEIEEAFELYARSKPIYPDLTIKPFLIATIDYTERLKHGEPVSFPPILHEGSQLSDYADWLNRDDMLLPATFQDFHAKIIGYTQKLLPP